MLTNCSASACTGSTVSCKGHRSMLEYGHRKADFTGAEGSISTAVLSIMTLSRTAAELLPAVKSDSLRIFTTSCLMGSSSSSSLLMPLLRSCSLWNLASSIDPRVRVSSRASRRRLSYTTLATYWNAILAKPKHTSSFLAALRSVPSKTHMALMLFCFSS